MDISRVRKERLKMETEIGRAVQAAMNEFYLATGLSPRCVDVFLIDVTPLGAREKGYVLERVRATVDL